MTAARTAIVFPGQGSQHSSMLEYAPENDALDRLVDAAEALSGLDLREILTFSDPEELADTRVAQPLLYLVDWAWGVALLEGGIAPVAVAGHSLGELAALAIAGVYSPEAGLELVVERSKLMAAAAATTPGAMSAVIGLSSGDIEKSTASINGVWVANDNSDSQVVISGTDAGIEAATEALQEAGARRIIELKVAGPFHSPLMESARAAFKDILADAQFRDATIPVVQNTDPSPTTDADTIRERLSAQITSPVRWTDTMATLAADAPVTIIEAGPGAVLRGLTKGMTDVTAVSAETVGIEEVLEEVVQ